VDLSDDELAHATSQMDSGKPTPWKKQQTQDEEASSKKATRKETAAFCAILCS
jgi:hypothetical protein